MFRRKWEIFKEVDWNNKMDEKEEWMKENKLYENGKYQTTWLSMDIIGRILNWLASTFALQAFFYIFTNIPSCRTFDIFDVCHFQSLPCRHSWSVSKVNLAFQFCMKGDNIVRQHLRPNFSFDIDPQCTWIWKKVHKLSFWEWINTFWENVHWPIREDVKYYFADFVRKGGGRGVPPKSVTPFSMKIFP